MISLLYRIIFFDLYSLVKILLTNVLIKQLQYMCNRVLNILKLYIRDPRPKTFKENQDRRHCAWF